MKANNTPLTPEQSAFAAEKHNMIYAFLHKRKLPVDEFYDIVVFGFLRAVRRYLTEPGLCDRYAFSTIAFGAMRSSVSNYFEAQRTQKRNAIVIPFDEDTLYNAGALRDYANIYGERTRANVYTRGFTEDAADYDDYTIAA